jgi:hypothetical protein
MESPLFDLKNMKIILATLIASAMGEEKDREGQNIKVLLRQDEFGTIHFAVMRAGDTARKVALVYAGRGEDREQEPRSDDCRQFDTSAG